MEMKEHKIAFLRQMCFRKLSSLYPSDEKLAEFINHSTILKKIGISVVREQMKYEEDLESSAKNVSSCAYSDVPNDSCHRTCDYLRPRTLCSADNQLHEKPIGFHELLDTGESCHCGSCAFVPSNCLSTSSNEEKDGFSKTSEVKISFKREPDKYESKIIESSSSNAELYDLNLSREISGKATSSNLDTQIYESEDESIPIGRLIEITNDIQDEYSQAKSSNSFENSKDHFCEKIDLINISVMQDQTLNTRKYPATNNLGDNEKLPKVKNSENQKDYCEDFGHADICELLKCEDLKIPKTSYKKESVQGKCQTEEGMQLHLCETSEFQDNTISVEDFFETEYPNVKLNCSSEETSKYDEIDDDSLLEMLCSVFDSGCETEGKQDYEQFESAGKSENIHSEPYFAQILLYFLEKAKTNLQFREDKVRQGKLDFEDSVKELNSYDLEKITDGKELQDIANNLVSSYDKISVDIEKDRTECDRYSENLQSILNFYQEKILCLQ